MPGGGIYCAGWAKAQKLEVLFWRMLGPSCSLKPALLPEPGVWPGVPWSVCGSSSHSCPLTPQTPILPDFPSLTLEWNSLGMWEEGFSFFCQGLRANNFLQRLDLRNNQINHQGAGELAMALTQNTSLQELGKSSLPMYTYMHANTHVPSVFLPQFLPTGWCHSQFLSVWSALMASCREWSQPHGLWRVGTETGISGTKPTDEKLCTWGRTVFSGGRSVFIPICGMPHDRLLILNSHSLCPYMKFSWNFRRMWLLSLILSHPQILSVEGRLVRAKCETQTCNCHGFL